MRAACPSLDRFAWGKFPICSRISTRRDAADDLVSSTRSKATWREIPRQARNGMVTVIMKYLVSGLQNVRGYPVVRDHPAREFANCTSAVAWSISPERNRRPVATISRGQP
jgi:hypothetical protein